jgi:hypothetical protein
MIKVKLTDLTIGIKCPAATQDLELNTKNRNNAIQADYIQYGPLNVDEPGDYWEKIADHWDTTEEAAKKSLCGNCTAFDISPRMKECMPGETSDKDGELGYCHMHKFKCHSARSCYTWAKGGPIEDNDISVDWQTKGDKEEQLDEKRKKRKKKKKSSGKKDACYYKVKSRYRVFPSAYASGALVKCRKVGAKNWGKSKKNENIEETIKLTLESNLSEKKKRKKRKLTKKPSSETSLRDWFKRKGAKGSKSGWVDCNAPDGKGGYKACGRSKGEKRSKYPACRPTPAACKSRGKGKSWGKKARKGLKESVEKLERYEKFLHSIKEAFEHKIDIIYEQDENEEGGDKTVIKFPKFKINEKHWGKNLNSEDRAVIERIGSQLQGDDPLDRVEYLETFLSEAETVKEDITVGEVMGALMFLDIFASIVFEFNASVAGFLFEALFAGIFEGFQIEAKEGGGEAGTTDVILNVRPKGKGSKSGVEYSFKLLTDSPSAVIKGSFKDLIDGISKSSDSQETYLVVLKTETDDAMDLDFYEYDINKENWFEWVGVPKVKNVKTYEEKEFEFGAEGTPKIVMDNLIEKPEDAIVGKIVDGEFKKRPTEAQSRTSAGYVSKRRQAYDELSEEEVGVFTPRSKVINAPYGLRNEAGEIPKFLFTGRKYKMKVDAGTKRTLDYTAGANFKELYKDFLKPGAFSAEVGDKTYTDFGNYVAEGAYKEDPDFFKRLKELGTYTGKGGAGQFKTTGGYMKRHPDVRGPQRLTLDRKRFQAAADAYTSLVGKQIFDIFTNLSELIDDVSGYFLGVSANERNRFAKASKDKSKELAKSAEENLVEVPEMADPTGARAKSLNIQKRKQRALKTEEIKESKEVKLVIKKNLIRETTLRENLQFHLENNIPVDNSVLRPGSKSHISLIREAKQLWKEGRYFATETEEELFDTDMGEYAIYEEQTVPLDVPMLNEYVLDEKKKKKKTPQLGKPTRNAKGKKKYKVFVRNPKTGNIMKITFGDKKGGLEGNWNDPEARKSFAKRHKCAQKNDRTKAGYWACRAHKFFGKNVPGRFW